MPDQLLLDEPLCAPPYAAAGRAVPVLVPALVTGSAPTRMSAPAPAVAAALTPAPAPAPTAAAAPTATAAVAAASAAAPGRALRGLSAVVSVPLALLQPGESPRLAGQDAAHVARLAEVEGLLPPILVDRRTMQVIDGTHRLMAAALNARPTIDVVFFDGDPADAFLYAVEANVAHGFPLSQADRRAAAERIVRTHYHLSDRAIAQITGLSAKTVALLRRESDEGRGHPAGRIGRDGRVRPLSGLEGRVRVAELIRERPQASVRELARIAGVSPTTASDVRKRLLRGEQPARSPHSPAPVPAPAPAPVRTVRPPVVTRDPTAVLEKLLRNPSLRHTENGRHLLRLMQVAVTGARDLPDLATAVPEHCKDLVRQAAEQYAQKWAELARTLV